MQIVQIESLLENRLLLVLIVVVLVLLFGLGILIFLRLLRGGRPEEENEKDQLYAMNRHPEFESAVEQTKFLKSSDEVARHIAQLFREYLNVPLLAIYAGKPGQDTLSNILSYDEAGRTDPLAKPAKLPDTIFATALQAFPRPQVTIAAEITGGVYQESQADSGELVVVAPWRGAFFWGGILVGQPAQPFNPEIFTQVSDLVSRLGDRLGVALEIGAEQAQAGRNVELARKGFDFARSILASSGEPAPIAAMAREVASLVGAGSAAIWLVDPDSSMIRMAGSYGLRNEDFLPLPVGQGLAGGILETGEPLALDDAPSDARCLFPREARENGIVSYLGYPILSGGKTVGVVEAHTAQPRSWQDADWQLLGSAAEILAQVLSRETTQSDRLKVETSYLALSEALQRLRSPDELMEAAVEVLGHALGVSRAIAISLDESGEAEPVKHEYRGPDVSSCSGHVFDESFVSTASNAITGDEVVEISDSPQQSLSGPQEAERLHVLSEMIVPVRVEGLLKGFIYLHQCDRVRQWQDDEIGFAKRVGRQLSLSLTNLCALEKVSSEAEAAREEARRAREGGTHAQDLVTSLPEAVIGIDQEGRLSFFNAAARDWLGLKNDDLGRMVEMTEALAVTDDSLWEKVLASKSFARFQASLVRLTGSEFGGEAGSPTQGATPVPVSISVAPIPGEKGTPKGSVIVISDVGHVTLAAEQSSARIRELERDLSELGQSLSDARSVETELRAAMESAKAAESEARATLEASRRQESELRKEFDRLREEEGALRKSAQQLLEINRLKSEFIVNAGHELEASLQSVLGFAELLEQGSYGTLTEEQIQAVRNVYNYARRMKQDVEWLVEYGSTRSRRLEPGGETTSS